MKKHLQSNPKANPTQQHYADTCKPNKHSISFAVTAATASGRDSGYSSGHPKTPLTRAAAAAEGPGAIDYTNLYVSNVDSTFTSRDLFTLFKTFGRIISARIMTRPSDGRSKGYGFVSYTTPFEAAAALKAMDGKVVGSRALLVSYHKQRRTFRPVEIMKGMDTRSSKNNRCCPSTARRRSPTTGENNQAHTVLLTTAPTTTTDDIDPIKASKPSSNQQPKDWSGSSDSGKDNNGRSSQEEPGSQLPQTQTKASKQGSCAKAGQESVNDQRSVTPKRLEYLQRNRLAEATLCALGPTKATEVQTVVGLLMKTTLEDQSFCLFNPEYLKKKLDVNALVSNSTAEPAEGVQCVDRHNFTSPAAASAAEIPAQKHVATAGPVQPHQERACGMPVMVGKGREEEEEMKESEGTHSFADDVSTSTCLAIRSQSVVEDEELKIVESLHGPITMSAQRRPLPIEQTTRW